MGSGGIVPRVVNLGARRRWVVSFKPRTLYRGENVPGTYLIWNWVRSRTGLDAVVNRENPSPCRE